MADITDDQLAVLMAGALAAMVTKEAFPVALDPANLPYQDGEESAFVLTTQSGLLYRVGVKLIGQN